MHIELCKHDILIEWCHDCRHLAPEDAKDKLTEHYIAIVENLLAWSETPTTSR